MRKMLVLASAAFLLIQSVRSQMPAIEHEHWAEKPVIHPVDSKNSLEPAFTVFDKKRIEFIDDSANSVLEFFSQHKIIHLNDDHGIEYYNKIYIQVSDFSDVIEVKARTILPNGKIIELNNQNIKDLKDEDGTLYKIFALEGLEKGCEIEYYFTSKKPTSYFGKVTIQEKFPVTETTFELIAPTRLVFETKLYNRTAISQTDTLPNDKSRISLHVSEIPGLEEEKYASYRVNLARIEYKLSYNNSGQKGERLFTWNELAKRIYAMYGNYSEKEMKKLTGFVSDRGWGKLSDDSIKIISVENYIKKYFTYRKDVNGDDAANIEVILKSKIADGLGMMRLYGAIFRIIQVDYQFVLAADRDDEIIDRNFENWDNCEYPMIYFPSTHAFLVPTKIEFRYPWIFPAWGNGYALFCKNISLGTMNSAIAEIKMIPLENYRRTYSNLDSKIQLNGALDTLQLDMKLIYGGYLAAFYRDNFDFLTSDQKQETIKAITKQYIGSETIPFSELENTEFEEGNTTKPFIIHIKVNSGDLIERAGNKILLKIGLVIGPQTEMYQEKERQLPITMDYAHYEQRKIEFIIPEGYTIKNLNDLKLEQVYKENGIQTMGFISDYKITGNLLTIDIMEDYRKTNYPVSQYEDFRKIINTSSDFNKVVLILEKIKQ